jgi:hypothetical protein
MLGSAPSAHTSAVIAPYQTIRNSQNLPLAPQGHPSPSPSSSMQPFLGFNSLSPPLTSQVNQHRLSAAASHNPRQARLPTRGRRRGPAIAPPSMPRPPCITDCLIDVETDAGIVPGIRVKVKVYPPQVSLTFTSHFRSLIFTPGKEF